MKSFSSVTIIGSGASALAVAAYCCSKNIPCLISDTESAAVVKGRLEDAGLSDCPWEADGHSDAVFDADIAVISPGVWKNAPICKALQSHSVPIVSEMEFGAALSDSALIAVTGTAGKSTTVAFLENVLCCSFPKARACGNIGIPVTAVSQDMDSQGVRICEVSSFQMEWVTFFAPDISLILNIFPNHLDRHGDFSEYAGLKMKMAALTKPSGMVILNGRQKLLVDFGKEISRKVIFFGKKIPGYDSVVAEDNRLWYRDSRGKKYGGVRLSAGILKGVHNRHNYMAAYAVACIYGVSGKDFEQSMSEFSGLPHRMKSLGVYQGVEFINDSKSTTVQSLEAALVDFEDASVHLLCGGRDKGGDFNRISPLVANKCRAVYLFGESAEKIADAWHSSSHICRYASLEDAFSAAQKNAVPGENVLLSPACASFDMFQNYEERGRLFETLCREYCHES
jgi:UDP-N-acetylmuramoylalanine--D-glutamate ligase